MAMMTAAIAGVTVVASFGVVVAPVVALMIVVFAVAGETRTVAIPIVALVRAAVTRSVMMSAAATADTQADAKRPESHADRDVVVRHCRLREPKRGGNERRRSERQ